jgi:cysteine desulfurase/selenocysteine lyase
MMTMKGRTVSAALASKKKGEQSNRISPELPTFDTMSILSGSHPEPVAPSGPANLAAPLPHPLDPYRWRPEFPILQRKLDNGKPLVYLDNAASTQHPQRVIDAMSDCYQRYYANVHRGSHTLSGESTLALESARETCARFIGAASTHEVIFAAGTTAAINTVARAWGDWRITANDTILLTIAEHHANIVPWQQLAQRTGCKLEFLPIDDAGEIADDVVEEHLRRTRPKLMALTAVSNVLGTEYPVERWTRLAHQAGATVLIDAAQAAPHQPLDVKAWDADFVVFSGHKLCGPTGIGILYGKRELLEEMPPFLGGGAMIRTVTTEGFTTSELPTKFEAGTPPIVEAIGLAEAMRFVDDVGLDAIHRHEQQLAAAALRGLTPIEGLKIFGPPADRRGGIVSFVVEGGHTLDLAHWLDRRGIAIRDGHHCAMPLHQRLGVSGSCRASFYLYNTLDEVEALCAAVAEFQQRFIAKSRKRNPSSV